MEHLFLIGALTYLVVSWLYILALKAKVRDCMTYIQNRIDKANPECEGLNHRPQAGKGLRDTGAPSQLSLEDEPAPGKGAMDGKPKLIVGGSDSFQPLQYLCSHCLRPFYLASNQPPKEAVAELLHNFEEHVEREHPSAAPHSNMPPREGGSSGGI